MTRQWTVTIVYVVIDNIFTPGTKKKCDQKNDQKYGICTGCTVTVSKMSARLTGLDAAMDRNYIVCRNGQYFCVQDQKSEIEKIDQKYGTCTGCTVTVSKMSAHMNGIDAVMDNNYIVCRDGQHFLYQGLKNEIKKLTKKNMARVQVIR